MKNDTSNRSTCIAVLPFENLSGDSDHDYFATEFVEDLITDLSRFHSLQVISSYTSQKMGTGSSDGLAEAKALAVSYLLKGSLRRKADQIRITTQLIEVAGGGVIWAERYDAPLGTIFDIQDDIVERVAGALSAQIDQVLLAAARDKPLTSLAAYDCWLRGMDLVRKGTPAADQNARKIFEQALIIDPNYSRAYAGLSLSYFNDWSCQVWENWDATERNTFKKQKRMWQMAFEDTTIQLPEVKGFFDLARLLATPGEEVHCTEMMGTPDSLSNHDTAIDEKARQAYARRIRELHDEIATAEEMNDLGRMERLSTELDQLTEHLTKNLGIGRRARPLNAPAERARAAVTWRIRNAIKKINTAHPALGHHLAHAIRTGNFCSYTPEKDQVWNQ